MGHAGAIISGSKGTAQAKMEALVGRRGHGGAEPDRGGRGHGRHRPEARLSPHADPRPATGPRSAGRPIGGSGRLRPRRAPHRLGAVLAPGGDRGLRLASGSTSPRPTSARPWACGSTTRCATGGSGGPGTGMLPGRGRTGGHRPGGRAGHRRRRLADAGGARGRSTSAAASPCRWRSARAPTPWSSRPPSAGSASNGRSSVWHSAEWEPLGKPHPGAYLSTAAKLGVDPTACLAVEDSFNGAISAKAARMRVVAVPEPAARSTRPVGASATWCSTPSPPSTRRARR